MITLEIDIYEISYCEGDTSSYFSAPVESEHMFRERRHVVLAGAEDNKNVSWRADEEQRISAHG